MNILHLSTFSFPCAADMHKLRQVHSKPCVYYELIPRKLRKHRRYLACAMSTVQADSRASGVYQIA